MSKFDLVVRSQRVVTTEGVVPGAVAVHDGRVHAVRDHGATIDAHRHTDLGATALLPGLVDLDVGVQPPVERGARPSLRTCYTRAAGAALRGGVTTMAIAPAPAAPAITDGAAVRAHHDAVSGMPTTRPTIVFLGGLTSASPRTDLVEMCASGAVAGWCSLSDGGFPDLAAIDQPGLRNAMAELAVIGAPLLAHVEDAGELAGTGDGARLPARRPPRAERRGLERMIAAARASGARTHITPFSAAECAALVTASHCLGVRVSSHTCPHYLCLPAEQAPPVLAGGQCRPPLRPAASRAALWDALLGDDPVITTVGSGHRAGTGVATLPMTLPALWTAAARRGRGLTDLVRWTSARPAALLGLESKGAIRAGADADLVAFCPDSRWQVPADDGGPYAGRWLTGRVLRTWVAGVEANRARASQPALTGEP